MSNRKRMVRWFAAAAVFASASSPALAQPDPVPVDPPPVPVDPVPVPVEPEPVPEADLRPEWVPPDPAPEPPRRPEPPPPLPEVLVAPSGRLLPAGIIYSRSSLDTGGGLSSDLRVGLGDVAEFGVATTDTVGAKLARDDKAERIFPYATAIFKMGVTEHRLFRHSPAFALGFRKSFERNQDDHATQFAELHLVGTLSLGANAVIHVGGVFWDASVTSETDSYLMHRDGTVAQQIRPFGGVELRAKDDALILIDLYWAPEYCYQCATKVDLKAILSWGVRYEVADSVRLESGVRVPDIQDVNLLGAQIFGQITFLNRHLRRLVHRE